MERCVNALKGKLKLEPNRWLANTYLPIKLFLAHFKHSFFLYVLLNVLLLRFKCEISYEGWGKRGENETTIIIGVICVLYEYLEKYGYVFEGAGRGIRSTVVFLINKTKCFVTQIGFFNHYTQTPKRDLSFIPSLNAHVVSGERSSFAGR